MLGEPEHYEVTELAEWLHDFPHVDLTFTLFNNTFAPENEKYRESLYFLAALPVVWLVLSIFALSVYMCCRCCWCVTKKQPRKHRQKICCLNWAVLLLIIICGVLLALSFYGNEQTNDGVKTVVSSINKVNKTIDELSQRVDIFDTTLVNLNTTGTQNLYKVVDQNIPNSTVKFEIRRILDRLQAHCTTAKNNIDVIKSTTNNIRLDNIEQTTSTVEFYRWVCTIVILCIIVIACLAFMVGVVKHSRGILIASVVFGTFGLVLVYAASGLYLASSVAAGDLCVDPDDFVMSHVTSDAQPTLEIYLTCKEDPYNEKISAATQAFTEVTQTVNSILAILKPFHIDNKLEAPLLFIRQQVKYGLSNVTRIGALVTCTNLHNDYVDALYGLCDTALLGMVFMMLACFVMGIAMTVIIIIASVVWRYYGKIKDRYESDDGDPFLPRPPPYNGYGAIPSECVASVHDNARGDPRSSNRSSLDMGVSSTSYQPNESPPPAYTNRNGRQYNISYRRVNHDPATMWNDQIQHAGHGYDPKNPHGSFHR